MSNRPCFCNINLNNLKFNIENIKKASFNKKIIATVKANAYGHGAIDISKFLLSNGIDMLSVACYDEAFALRAAGIKSDILILGPIGILEIKNALINNITLCANSLNMLKNINDAAKELNIMAKVHLAIDTGMNRVGFNGYEDVDKLCLDIKNYIYDFSNIYFEGIFTHFSTSDEDNNYMTLQYNRFSLILNLLVNNMNISFKYIHCSNSGAILNLSEHICNCIRPGIILYGYYPSDYKIKDVKVKPLMELKANISQIKTISKDTPVGYGRKFIANRDTKIATIPIGYADGLRRSLSNRGHVFIRDFKAPIVGNICMDQAMIDITEAPFYINEGDTVDVIGNNYDAKDMANDLDTIVYEVLCDITSRVPRNYIF